MTRKIADQSTVQAYSNMISWTFFGLSWNRNSPSSDRDTSPMNSQSPQRMTQYPVHIFISRTTALSFLCSYSASVRSRQCWHIKATKPEPTGWIGHLGRWLRLCKLIWMLKFQKLYVKPIACTLWVFMRQIQYETLKS